MVKVDELNEYIGKFGDAMNRLDTIAESVQKIEETATKQEAISQRQEMLEEKQAQVIDSLEKKWNETQLAINNHMDNVERHLSDKIDLTEHIIEQSEDKLAKVISDQIKDIKTDLSNYNIKLEENINSIKKLHYVTIALVVVAAAVTVLMHFI